MIGLKGASRAAGRVLRDALLILFGFAVLWFFLPVVVYGVLNIGNLTGLAAGIFGILAVLFFDKIRIWLHKRTGKIICAAVIACATAALVCAAVITSDIISAAVNTPPGDGRTAIVLGCQVNGETPSLMLRTRIDAAKDYLEKHPDAVCILSGGQGEDEDISEAQCMFDALVLAGIDRSRLYMEDQSTSTAENIRFSMEIIRENGLPEDVCIVTNEFHQYRAGLLARRHGVSVCAVSAPSPVVLLPTYVVREYYAVLADRFIRKGK